MRAVLRTIRNTAKLIGAHWKLWLPFFVIAVVELLLIGIVWLAPHPPFSKVLAPPVRFFFNDRVLHYPLHLWFMYHAMKHTAFLSSIIIGAYMTGIACAMVRQAHGGKPLSLHGALVSRQVRYGTVLLVWLITWGLVKGIFEAVSQFAPKTDWVAWSSLGLMILLQVLFIYVIPAAVFEGVSWWRALLRGIRETNRYPISTLLVVIIPISLIVAFSVMFSPTRMLPWMLAGDPERIFWVIGSRLLLWTAADAVMTVSVAHLWWFHRASDPAVALGKTEAAPSPVVGRLQEGPAVA